MADDLLTPGGNPITIARDVDVYPATPEIVFTADGTPIEPVRFQEAVSGTPEPVFTPGGRPLRFVCDVDRTPAAQDVTISPGDNAITPVRVVENLVQPEDVYTPLGNAIEVLQMVDTAGAYVTRSVAYNFMTGAMPAGATLTRASTGWHFNNQPSLAAAATDVARFDYNVNTGALRGLLVEAAATNSVRNASAGGTVNGSPGTPPTTWAVQASPAMAVARTVVGAGSEDGIPYWDVRWAGTASAGGGVALRCESPQLPLAAQGQAWWAAFYVRLMAGTLTGVTFNGTLGERSAADAQVAFQQTGLYVPTSAALRTQKKELQRTLTNAACLYLVWDFNPIWTNGGIIDFTLRMGLPQLQQIPAAGSPIVTTAAAVTRAADVLTLTPFPRTYANVAIVRESGTTNVPNVTVTGAGYVVPTSVSPLQSVTFT